MAYFKATIEVLVDVENYQEACDAIAETMRPNLRAFAPESCVIDWRYHRSFPIPGQHSGSGFEYARQNDHS